MAAPRLVLIVMKHLAFSALAIALLAGSSFAQSKKFQVGTGNPTQQLGTVESQSDFETFTGRTDKVTGTIMFDPVKKTGSGKIMVDVASISTGLDLRDEHMRSEGWLNAEKHANITFETTSVKFLKGDTYQVTGKFTMKGVTKTITTTATVKYAKESEKTKAARFKGDVLQVRTSFTVKLSDYGVKIPAQAAGKVSNTVTISVSAYGQTGA